MQEIRQRDKPIPFRYSGKAALVNDRFKLLSKNLAKGEFELYDLLADPEETRNVSAEHPEIAARMNQQLLAWNLSVDASFSGQDYPETKVAPPDPNPAFWYDVPAYEPYLDQWKNRWEYRSHFSGRRKARKSASP